MNRFELLRYNRGLTQDEVASAIGVNRLTLARLESGQTRQPSAPTAKALADFYGMTVAELLGVEDVAA